MNRLAWARVGVGVAALVSLLCLWAANNDLQAKLAAAELEGSRWQAAAEAGESKITALQGAARECLDRETRAQTDAAERAAIMESARPRERTAAENKGVVDDSTRKKAVDRLNRPL